MKKDRDIKIRQATTEDMEQLCKARNNEKLFTGYLGECDCTGQAKPDTFC